MNPSAANLYASAFIGAALPLPARRTFPHLTGILFAAA
jgi:hypothetical protein